MAGTLRDYPVTHCDDRHQATGGPIRGFAVEGQDRVLDSLTLEILHVDQPQGRRSRPRRRAGSGKRAPQTSGLLASIRAVVGGHAADLWGVVLVTVGVLAALAFYADSLNPAGHYARLAVGDLLGWGRFLVPPVALAVGLLLLVGHGHDTDARSAPSRPGR